MNGSDNSGAPFFWILAMMKATRNTQVDGQRRSEAREPKFPLMELSKQPRSPPSADLPISMLESIAERAAASPRASTV
jgi:hypothetical protein